MPNIFNVLVNNNIDFSAILISDFGRMCFKIFARRNQALLVLFLYVQNMDVLCLLKHTSVTPE